MEEADALVDKEKGLELTQGNRALRISPLGMHSLTHYVEDWYWKEIKAFLKKLRKGMK